MNNKIIAVYIWCSLFCLSDTIAGMAAEVIVTGANISGKARVRMDQEKPDCAFETQALPPSPDYASGDAWAALPDKTDSADLAPSNTRYPEAQASAAADVFFIHPTTIVSARNNWNIPIDDAAAVKDVDLILGFCASAFNAAAKVYAPRYREAKIYAFFDERTASGIKAVDLAYRDVERAFLYYIKHYNQGRPFIIAGHSQGSIHGSRLLQEHIIGTPLMGRMIGAYLIGGTIPVDTPGIQPSRSATDTGVLIGWNAYTKDGDPAMFTDGLICWADGSYMRMGGKALIQVNPLSWELNGPEVAASKNPGSLPFPQIDGEAPLLVPAVCDADASGKVLIISRPAFAGFETTEISDIPLFNTRCGDYHCFDYQLFYESIRKNAVERVNAFIKQRT